MTLYRGPGGTGSATSDADTTLYQDFLTQTQAARDAALQAETNAELAEANAEAAEAGVAASAAATASSASAAASSASSASTSATNAASSASSASTSASNAASSASSASSSASAASTSATNAASSATAAASSASAASTSATNAANSATSASNSASTATTQATNAASSATAAASSATAAQSAQTAAEAARDAALSAYDNFDDRYLGPKASDPTLDNDGNALVTGALYFNTATNVMKVYDGSTWVAAYVSAAGVLLVANSLSDVASTATARANLNVPTRTGGDASGTWGINVTGNAATVTNGVYTTGDQTIAGTKTLSSNPILNAGTANGVAYLNGSKVLTTGSALTFDGTNFATTGSVTSAGANNSGNLAFTGTGNRITGDFSNATIANRVMFQTSTANSTTAVGVLPNGTGQIARVQLFSNSDPTNASVATVSSETSDVRFTSGISGTGTYVPMTFYTGGSERMRLDTSGNLGIGTSSPAHRLHVAGNAFVPLTNSYYCYTADYGMGTPDSGGLQVFSGSGDSIRFGKRSSGTFTENVRIDGSGNVGIGTSSSTTLLTLSGSAAAGKDPTLTLANTTASTGRTYQIISGDGGPLRFQDVTAGVERARIDTSGNLLVGTTSQVGFNGGAGANINANGAFRNGVSGSGDSSAWQRSSTGNYLAFFYGALNTNPTGVGSINTNGTSTTYSTSSDYRLKHDIQPMTGALAKVAALKPVTYKWNVDGSDGEGFIAHELAEVCPDAVTGEKDAVDEDGNPKYQGIDTSFLVATLTAAIQEQQAIIDAQQAALNQLTARIEALEQA